MASDRVVINLEERARQAAREASPRGDAAPSKDAMALAFVQRYGAEYRYVAPRCRWTKWSRKRWLQDFTGSVFALIRKFVLQAVSSTEDERSAAAAAKVASDTAGVRRGTAAA